jgi:2-keto-4-pentenoate hydratase
MSDIDRAANIIYQCLQKGDAVDYVKSNLWPETMEEGYAVQTAIHQRTAGAIKGWKIAATAVAGRAHINVDRPLAGRLLSSMCFADGAQLPFGSNRMAVAEAEFVFTLGRDMPPRKTEYSTEEVALSIQSLHAGLEFPDSRFVDFTLPGTAGLIADNACAWQFVLGDPTTEMFDPTSLSDHPTSLIINGETATTGKGSDALGGPLTALVWIANTLSQLGIGMQAGQFVTTGVTGLPTPVKRGDTVCANLGKFGSASATLV